MIKNILKTLGIILLLILAGVRLGFVWKTFSLDQSIDYSIKSSITIGVIMLVCYLISLISLKK